MHPDDLHSIYWIGLILVIVLFVAFGLDLNPHNRPLSYGPVTPSSPNPQFEEMVAQVNQVGEGHLSQVRQFSPDTVGYGFGATVCLQNNNCKQK